MLEKIYLKDSFFLMAAYFYKYWQSYNKCTSQIWLGWGIFQLFYSAVFWLLFEYHTIASLWQDFSDHTALVPARNTFHLPPSQDSAIQPLFLSDCNRKGKPLHWPGKDQYDIRIKPKYTYIDQSYILTPFPCFGFSGELTAGTCPSTVCLFGLLKCI